MAKGISHSALVYGILLIGVLSVSLSLNVNAAPGPPPIIPPPGCPPACPPSPANCDANLVITATQDLQFGSMTAGTGGTVIVDTTGVAMPTGDVLLVGGGSTAASFSMSTGSFACAGRALVTVTAGPAATLTHASLPATMTVDSFSTSPVPGDAFDPTIPLLVGATLHVGASQDPGSYSGTFLVTVTFQ